MSSPLVVETARAWLRGRGRDEGGGGGGWAGAVRERVAWTALEQSALERRVTALETRATSSSLTTMVTATTTTTTAPNESSDRRRAVGVSSSTCQTDEQSPDASQRRSLDIYIQRHHLKRSVSTEEPAAAPAAPSPPPHRHCLETAAPVPPSSSLVSRPPPKWGEDAKSEHTSLTRVLGDVKTNKEKAFRSGNEWKKFLSPEMFTVMPMSGLVPGVLRRTRSPTSTAVEGRLLDLEERIKILEKSVDVDRGGKSIDGRDIEEDLMFVHPDAIALERCRSVCKSILGSEVDISITTAPSWHRRVDDPRAARGCTVSRGVTADDGTYSVPEWERTNRRKMDHGSLLFRDEGTDAQLVIIRPNHVVPRIDRRFPQSVGVQFSAFPMMFEAYTQASDEPKDESEHQQRTDEDSELGGSLQEKDDHEPKPQTSKEKDESGHRRNTLHKNVSLHSIVSIRSVRSESGHRSQSDLRKFQQKDNEPVYHHHSQVPSVYPWMEPWKLRRHDGICCGCGPNKQCLRTHKNKNGSMMERTSRAWSMKHGPSMDYRSSYWGPDSDKHKARPIVRMRRHDDDDDMEPKAIKSIESISDPRLGLRGDWSDKESDGEQGAGWAWRNVEERPSHSPDGSTKGDQPTGGKSPAFPGQLNDPAMGTDLFMGVQRSGSDTSLTSVPLRAASNGEPPPTPGPPPPTPAPATQDAKRASLGGRPGRDLRGGERGTGRGKRCKACRAAKAAKASSSRRRFSVCVRPASHRGVGVVSVDVYTGCPPRASRPVVSNYCLPPPYCPPVPSYCPPGYNGAYRRRYAW